LPGFDQPGDAVTSSVTIRRVIRWRTDR
jgi:hypothetical protein